MDVVERIGNPCNINDNEEASQMLCNMKQYESVRFHRALENTYIPAANAGSIHRPERLPLLPKTQGLGRGSASTWNDCVEGADTPWHSGRRTLRWITHDSIRRLPVHSRWAGRLCS